MNYSYINERYNTMERVRLVFASIYLAVDLLYIFASKSTYEAATKSIQGHGFPKTTPSRVLGALIAYTGLVVGWYVFAAKLATELARTYHPIVAGMLAGGFYGFVVYGVFNGTMHVMLDNWDVAISLRDTAWGVSWGAILTTLYITTVKAQKK